MSDSEQVFDDRPSIGEMLRRLRDDFHNEKLTREQLEKELKAVELRVREIEVERRTEKAIGDVLSDQSGERRSENRWIIGLLAALIIAVIAAIIQAKLGV